MHGDSTSPQTLRVLALNGILPVLLSFRDNRPVASKCQDAFCVLVGDAAHTSKRSIVPPSVPVQLDRVLAVSNGSINSEGRRWLRALPAERDRRCDKFAAILLRQMRYLFRS
jgi:hypothetical protein